MIIYDLHSNILESNLDQSPSARACSISVRGRRSIAVDEKTKIAPIVAYNSTFTLRYVYLCLSRFSAIVAYSQRA